MKCTRSNPMKVRGKGVVMKYLGVLFDFLLFPLFFLNRLAYQERRGNGDAVYKKGYHYHLISLLFLNFGRSCYAYNNDKNR